jgi:hypothetical protein
MIFMAAAKRTTKRGLGAGRSDRSTPPPPKNGKRAAPIIVPSMRLPRVEDVGKSEKGEKRGTLKRAPSSDETRAPKITTPEPRIAITSVPVLTPNAGMRRDKQIEPSDAFLLSRIDGQLQAADLADLTGMSERDVVASLRRLLKAGLVTIA